MVLPRRHEGDEDTKPFHKFFRISYSVFRIASFVEPIYGIRNTEYVNRALHQLKWALNYEFGISCGAKTNACSKQ